MDKKRNIGETERKKERNRETKNETKTKMKKKQSSAYIIGLHTRERETNTNSGLEKGCYEIEDTICIGILFPVYHLKPRNNQKATSWGNLNCE